MANLKDGLDRRIWQLVATAAGMAAAATVRRLAITTWRSTRHEDPPENPAARDVGWRDAPPEMYRAGPETSDLLRRRASFLANRGLQGPQGEPKPAWKEWVEAGRPASRR